MKKTYAFAYLAALALVAAGSLFSVTASAEDKANPKSTRQEQMKQKDMDSDSMKSDDTKSDDSESDQMGGEDMGTQD
jgi:Spy/CpxP family protein refolding chaperone